MSLFHSKIDPFCSLTVNLGPLYVERVFDSVLTRQGVSDVVRMTDPVRFGHYLAWLRRVSGTCKHAQYPLVQFYRGHFYQQLANNSTDPKNSTHFREKALCYYQTYLELPHYLNESSYYAQWQSGLLQEALHYPWSQAEESLQKATTIDPLRGEATIKIMGYYIHQKEWKTAWHYSSIAVEKFYDKNPVAQRRWFIDFDAYNWKVIRTHRIISYKLGYLKEKNTVIGTTSNQTVSQ